MMPGPTQIVIILLVVILLFGAKKLPQLARSLGSSIGEFKKGREESELETSAPEKEQPAKESENKVA